METKELKIVIVILLIAIIFLGFKLESTKNQANELKERLQLCRDSFHDLQNSYDQISALSPYYLSDKCLKEAYENMNNKK